MPANELLKMLNETVAPEQTVILAGWARFGIGLILILNSKLAPLHPLRLGLTVIVSISVLNPLFVAIKLGMFPVPWSTNPMSEFLLSQV